MLSQVLPFQTKVELEKLKVAFCIAVEFNIALVPLTRPAPTLLNVEFWLLLPEEGGGGDSSSGGLNFSERPSGRIVFNKGQVGSHRVHCRHHPPSSSLRASSSNGTTVV
jgi:hypothetical protein